MKIYIKYERDVWNTIRHACSGMDWNEIAVQKIIQQAINEAYQAGQRDFQTRAAKVAEQGYNGAGISDWSRDKNQGYQNGCYDDMHAIQALPILEEPK